jgi:hypothetical protein
LKTIRPDFAKLGGPVLTLAFDEAHTISGDRNGDRNGNAFFPLRRAIRQMRKLPIWSVFLSTTGKLNQSNPPPFMDPSGRMVSGELVNVTPFSALGFDALARKLRKSDSISLEHVTQREFRLSLGRPL